MSIDSTQTNDHAKDPTRKRRLLRVSADAAVVVLLFSAMFSSWVLMAVAGALFVGPLVYAWYNFNKAERNAFVLRAIASALIAGGIAGAWTCSRAHSTKGEASLSSDSWNLMGSSRVLRAVVNRGAEFRSNLSRSEPRPRSTMAVAEVVGQTLGVTSKELDHHESN